MDKQTADKMSAALLGKTIGGWLIQKYINHGKSAVIFLGQRAGEQSAVKVFDSEIVERYGRDAQLEVFVYRVEGVVKSRDFHKTVDKSREFGYLKLDEWERVQRICRN